MQQGASYHRGVSGGVRILLRVSGSNMHDMYINHLLPVNVINASAVTRCTVVQLITSAHVESWILTLQHVCRDRKPLCAAMRHRVRRSLARLLAADVVSEASCQLPAKRKPVRGGSQKSPPPPPNFVRQPLRTPKQHFSFSLPTVHSQYVVA